MNNNKQIEKIAHKILGNATEYGSKNAPIGSRERSYYETEVNGIVKGINWQKQQDEARMLEQFDKGFTAGSNETANRLNEQYKELLDSHNELLRTLEHSRSFMTAHIPEKIFDMVDGVITKAKNIKL